MRNTCDGSGGYGRDTVASVDLDLLCTMCMVVDNGLTSTVPAQSKRHTALTGMDGCSPPSNATAGVELYVVTVVTVVTSLPEELYMSPEICLRRRLFAQLDEH